jgi:hypothetical protein
VVIFIPKVFFFFSSNLKLGLKITSFGAKNCHFSGKQWIETKTAIMFETKIAIMFGTKNTD